MITEKELIENGFIHNGEWNNRTYYIKKGFRIVNHNGIYCCDDDDWSGSGDKIETIDELNKLYETYLDKAIIQLETILKYLKY
jgi:uncharacterized protein related to proFAR isomerase